MNELEQKKKELLGGCHENSWTFEMLSDGFDAGVLAERERIRKILFKDDIESFHEDSIWSRVFPEEKMEK